MATIQIHSPVYNLLTDQREEENVHKEIKKYLDSIWNQKWDFHPSERNRYKNSHETVVDSVVLSRTENSPW